MKLIDSRFCNVIALRRNLFIFLFSSKWWILLGYTVDLHSVDCCLYPCTFERELLLLLLLQDLELALYRDLGALKIHFVIEVLRGCLLWHAGLNLGQEINLSSLIICGWCGVCTGSPPELTFPQGILDPLQSKFEVVFLAHLVVDMLGSSLLLVDRYLKQLELWRWNLEIIL